MTYTVVVDVHYVHQQFRTKIEPLLENDRDMFLLWIAHRLHEMYLVQLSKPFWEAVRQQLDEPINKPILEQLDTELYSSIDMGHCRSSVDKELAKLTLSHSILFMSFEGTSDEAGKTGICLRLR